MFRMPRENRWLRRTVSACVCLAGAATLGCTEAPDDAVDDHEADLILPEEGDGDAPAPLAGALPPAFVGDFESGPLRWDYQRMAWATTGAQWDYLRGAPPTELHPTSGQVSVTTNTIIVRQGIYAGRFILRHGDSADPTQTHNERLEVRSTVDQAGAVEGAEAWYGWSTYFPSGFRTRRVDLSPGNAIFTDWKPHGPVVNACIGNAEDGFLTPTAVFRVYAEPTGVGQRRPRLELTIAGGVLHDPSPTKHCQGAVTTTFTLIEDFVPGGWLDFVYHVEWSSDPALGFVEVWIDGRLALPRVAAATLYGGTTAYMKQGLYRAESLDTSWVVIDGTRRGSSYAEVAP